MVKETKSKSMQDKCELQAQEYKHWKEPKVTKEEVLKTNEPYQFEIPF